jgi:hypothetical protein
MSYFCQFCDKEMLIAASIVYQDEYITCGAEPCVLKARQTCKDIAHEQAMKTAKLLIFKTTTPDDESTWRIVHRRDLPEFIKEDEVLKGLFEGYVISLENENDDEPAVHYCARKADDVLRQISKDQQAVPAI